jgi:acetyl-CoA carboxylase carboxyl transferase subunit beta
MKVTKKELWKNCPECSKTLYENDLKDSRRVCSSCGYHFRMTNDERIAMLSDRNTFEEFHKEMISSDPLDFFDSKSYRDRIVQSVGKTGRNSAFIFGKARLGGHEIILGNLDFAFMGGSMGSVVGEKITLAAETAKYWKIPLVLCVASGGARMQEGVLSLMQMAKTSVAISALADQGIPYISILSHPTTGGVTASFAMQADIIIAEPNALIGFAGPRVIEQTIRKPLPKGFQSSEFNLEHGFVDMIIDRRDLNSSLKRILDFFKGA